MHVFSEMSCLDKQHIGNRITSLKSYMKLKLELLD